MRVTEAGPAPTGAGGRQSFHPRCGQRVSLSDEGTVARRALSDFNCGLVFSAQPLVPGRPFTVRIDQKVTTFHFLQYSVIKSWFFMM